MVSQHQELKLVRGIQVAPGDTASAESGYTIIDLLSGSDDGFALNADVGGWNPGLPAPKAGAWVDMPFVDGRYPYAGAEGSVTETMQLLVSASTHLHLSQLISDMADMVEATQRFWFDEFFDQPVFLHWWAHGAPGPQYALILQIDMDVSNPSVDDAGNIVRDVTLTIEREPFWRWHVPPGANPILWTLYAQNKQPGKDFDYLADLRIQATTSFPLLYALAQDTLENHIEYASLSFTVNNLGAENRLSIPAASIPGDAPALLQLAVRRTLGQVGTPQNFMYLIARSSRQRTSTARNGSIARYVTMIPFTAGGYGANVVQADSGGIGGFNLTTSTTIAASRLAITPGAMGGHFTASVALDKNIQRGRFAVFVRCRQNGGSSGDITLRVRAAYDGNIAAAPIGATVETETVVAPLQAGTGNTTTWPVVYCGSLRLPIDRDKTLSTQGSVGGSGQFNATLDNLVIQLLCARSTGSALLYFLDIILMPYDEELLDTATIFPSGTQQTTSEAILVDNTGYLARGKPEQLVVGINAMSSASSELDGVQIAMEQRGAQLTLEPGVENSIYVLEKNQAGESQPFSTMAASVNIVPRSRGIRTV